LLPEFIAATFAGEQAPQDVAGYYPPILTGLRGNHPGSFETAHSLRDGDFWSRAGKVTATDEAYDLVVVGAGISGLAAAHFYRLRREAARILILDNHDDFGGHAKRNEFELGGRLALMNGGTFSIDSPRPYSAVADGLLKTLGIDPVALTKKCADRNFYSSLGLGTGLFFDRETFGADKLVVVTGGLSWNELLAPTPLSPKARSDIARIEEEKTDYLPGLSSDEKKSLLSRISYRDFLLNVVKADPEVIPFYQTKTHGEWGVGIDAVSALDVWAFGFPGFQGLNLKQGSAPHMGYTAAGYADGGCTPSISPTAMPQSLDCWCAISFREVCRAKAPKTWLRREWIFPISITRTRRCVSGSTARWYARATSAIQLLRRRPRSRINVVAHYIRCAQGHACLHVTT